MSCAINAGYTIDCRDQLGGLDQIFIIDYNDVSAVAESSGLVTGITKATGKRFYKFEIPQGVAEGKDTGEGNTENGTIFFTHEVTFPLNKRDATTRNIIAVLSKSRVIIVVKDMNGRYTMYGKDFGLWGNSHAGTSGVAGGDRNGYNVTFTGPQREPVLEVNSATGAALQTPG
mgnify:CR=1 FL=1